MKTLVNAEDHLKLDTLHHYQLIGEWKLLSHSVASFPSLKIGQQSNKKETTF